MLGPLVDAGISGARKALMPSLKAAKLAAQGKQDQIPDMVLREIEAGRLTPDDLSTSPDAPSSVSMALTSEDLSSPAKLPQPRSGPPRYVKRTEDVGADPTDHTKPQGLYTSPADVDTTHDSLGGTKRFWETNPEANVLKVDELKWVKTKRGTVGEASGPEYLKPRRRRGGPLRFSVAPPLELRPSRWLPTALPTSPSGTCGIPIG